MEGGVREGEGVLLYPGGNVYEGQWQNDKREGKGRFSHLSGAVQVGGGGNIVILTQLPIQSGWWVDDGLELSVVTKTRPGKICSKNE